MTTKCSREREKCSSRLDHESWLYSIFLSKTHKSIGAFSLTSEVDDKTDSAKNIQAKHHNQVRANGVKSLVVYVFNYISFKN